MYIGMKSWLGSHYVHINRNSALIHNSDSKLNYVSGDKLQ